MNGAEGAGTKFTKVTKSPISLETQKTSCALIKKNGG